MVDIASRKHPLKRPPGYKPPVTRWMLKFPDSVRQINTLYIGVQARGSDEPSRLQLEQAIERWLGDDKYGPNAIDVFRVTEGFDTPESKVWVAYWTNPDQFERKSKLDLQTVWYSVGDGKESIGLWTEHFTTPVDRLETNYARTDHKPGLAQVEGLEQHQHDLSAYWGAGRDRLPAAAYDLFEKPDDLPNVEACRCGIGERLTGSNYNNMCHIRSGQWWAECDDEERRAYEDGLQGKLMTGMRYLWEHPEETGTIGLRFLQNLGDRGVPTRETCGAGFFRNWADLEHWSSRHPSHLAIFNGAVEHAKKFGEERKFMTWHEVFILKSGEASFEYINCTPRTGVIRWVSLNRETLN